MFDNFRYNPRPLAAGVFFVKNSRNNGCKITVPAEMPLGDLKINRMEHFYKTCGCSCYTPGCPQALLF